MIHLAEVAGSHEEEIGFCSYCGRLEAERRRVCSECGLGVRLHTHPAALRSPGSAFLVVRGDGIVSAASASAERRLGPTVGRPVSAVLAAEGLAEAIAVAAAGRPAPVTFRAGETNLTVAPCGHPPAALVVLERV